MGGGWRGIELGATENSELLLQKDLIADFAKIRQVYRKEVSDIFAPIDPLGKSWGYRTLTKCKSLDSDIILFLMRRLLEHGKVVQAIEE